MVLSSKHAASEVGVYAIKKALMVGANHAKVLCLSECLGAWDEIEGCDAGVEVLYV